MIKAILFDMDGVLNLYPTTFSEAYALREGFDPTPLREFFRTDWSEVLIGKKDLKKLLVQYKEVWHLKGSPEALLQDWFTTEDMPNKDLLTVIQQLRDRGIKCYMATNNEKYRVEYIKKETYKDMLDGIFSSAELGVRKPEHGFFQKISATLNLKPEEIAFFDDTEGHIEAAKALGIQAFRYENPAQVKSYLNMISLEKEL